MTPDQKLLVIWGGAIVAIIVVGLSVLTMRAGSLGTTIAQASELHGRYVKLYHPDTPKDGIPVADAVRELSRAKEQQAQMLEKVESAMVPELPRSYLASEVTSASAQVHADHMAIKQRAQSQHMELPATLPYDSGLDPDEAKRRTQLAYLYLYRAVLDQCLDAGVTKVGTISPGKAEIDPTGNYQLLACDFEIDVPYADGQTLLLNLLQAQTKLGIGVQNLSIEQVAENRQHLRLTASLITAAHPDAAASDGERKPAESPIAPPMTAPKPVTRRLGGGS